MRDKLMFVLNLVYPVHPFSIDNETNSAFISKRHHHRDLRSDL